MSSARKGGRTAHGAAPGTAAKLNAKRAAGRPPGAAVAVGKPVADFSLPATGGRPWNLAAARGSKLVLYFYPRDNTPGCTQEGSEFAALAARFKAASTLIAGISRDSLTSHEKFRDKMGYPFPLLSDEDEQVCRQFDVIRMKTLYGRSSLGVERSTFLLDAQGVLRREWRKVRVAGHAAEVLEAAKSL
ncbi:MAG TPA: peroxiredoxin [Steroidobacteraceae bacterium]|nr:peroxiredoxin [Steroidobacteraceae bacterium]